MNKPTFEETLKHEKSMIFPSDMSERTLTALAHHENVLIALEKQISKKPICYEDKYVCCPVCKECFGYKWEKYPSKLNDLLKGFKYCLNCGTAMDWSDYEQRV